MSEKQFVARNGIVAKANSTISGSLSVTGTITGSFSGSGTVESASFASTASYVNPLVQNVIITGSLLFGGQYGGTIQASNRGVNLYVGYNTIFGGSSGTDTAAFIVLRDAFSSQRNTRIKSDQNIYIGTRNSAFKTFIGGDGSGLETLSAKLQVKGSGTTSATTAFLVENANASASLQVTDDQIVQLKELKSFATDNTAGYFRLFNSSGALTRLELGRANAAYIQGENYSNLYSFGNSLNRVQSSNVFLDLIGTSGGSTSGIFYPVSSSVYFPSNHTGGSGYVAYSFNINDTNHSGTGSRHLFDLTHNGSSVFSISSSRAVKITGSLTVSGSGNFTDNLTVTGSTQIYKSGSTVLDIQGSSGQLFSVTDSLTGSLFSVNTVAGLPVMEAFSDNTVNIGKFGVYPIKVINSGSSALITGSITSAETASYVNPLVQDVLITGSTFISSSNATQLQVGDNSLFVSGSGNIGIGTATPISKLHVVGGYYGSGEIIFGSSTGRLTNSGNDIFLDAVNAGSLILRTTSAEGLRINSSRNVGIGTSALGSGISARLQVRGSGTTSATTSFRVENSSTLPIIEAKDSQNIGIGYQALNATLNIGNNSYNGSLAVAATGSQNRVALLGNIEIVSNSTGGSWSGQSIAAEGANRTFRFFAGGALNSSDAEAFNFKTYFTSTRTVDYTAFRFNGGYSNNSLAANYTYLLVDGIINQTSINQSGSVTGILYNPSFVSLTGSHTAIQTTSGDIKFQGNNTVEITGSTFISSSNDTQLQVGNNSLFVSSSGDIGVGTTSPAYKLQVNGTARFGDGSPYLKVNPSSVEVEGAYLFAAYQAGVSFYAYESVFRGLIKSDGSGGNALKLGDTAERMRITGSNVGIGTTTPTSRLQVKGSGTTSATTAFLVENANASASLWVTDDQTVNTRQLLIVNHATNASRTLRLGWGSVFATDANNELTLGSNFNDDNSTRIYISGKTSDNSPSDAITMQTNNGVAIYSGSSGAWFNPAARLHVSGSGIFTDNLTVTGSLIIDDSLFDTLNTSSLSSGSHLLYSFSTGSYQAGFFDYYVTSGSNFRAGTVMSIAGAGTYKFTDQATPDIGDTSNLQFSMSLSTSNLQLYASASSDGWTVKTTFRTI